MSVYNKPDYKTQIGGGTPTSSYVHKKTNSINLKSNTSRFMQEKSNKTSRGKLELTNPTENNIVNSNQNINKLLTSTNKNSRRIEINLNKNYSPMGRSSGGENIILLKHKQSTSQSNLNKKISLNENSGKECNIIINNNINNTKEKNNNKNNNINININISKKIISTYYNKSKDKNLIVKKKSVNSLNNLETKANASSKYYKIETKEDSNKNEDNSNNIIKKNSSNIVRKYSKKNLTSNANNINNVILNKNSVNQNSLGHFSTNSNMSTNTNKNNHYSKINLNNKGNINSNNNHINYTSNDIYNNNSNEKDVNNNNKNQGGIINKIIKDNKSMYLSQIKIPINSSCSPRNINIQNYLKYLHLGQNSSKNNQNNRTKNQKLSATNINYAHNNTEYKEYSQMFNNENSVVVQNNYKYNKKNVKDIPKVEIKKCEEQNSNQENINKEMNEQLIDCPEKLHFFYVKIFQKGKHINFDENSK